MPTTRTIALALAALTLVGAPVARAQDYAPWIAVDVDQGITQETSNQILFGEWIEPRREIAILINANGNIAWLKNLHVRSGNIKKCSDASSNLCFTWTEKNHTNECRYQVIFSKDNMLVMFILMSNSNRNCPSGIFVNNKRISA